MWSLFQLLWWGNFQLLSTGFEQPYATEPIYKTVQLVQNEDFFTMNWGEGGIGDSDTYYIDSSDWTIDSQHYFTTNRRIMYGFSN